MESGMVKVGHLYLSLASPSLLWRKVAGGVTETRVINEESARAVVTEKVGETGPGDGKNVRLAGHCT
jgi:hypothetical protein